MLTVCIKYISKKKKNHNNIVDERDHTCECMGKRNNSSFVCVFRKEELM